MRWGAHCDDVRPSDWLKNQLPRLRNSATRGGRRGYLRHQQGEYAGCDCRTSDDKTTQTVRA
jgi:hypothetical protein